MASSLIPVALGNLPCLSCAPSVSKGREGVLSVTSRTCWDSGGRGSVRRRRLAARLQWESGFRSWEEKLGSLSVGGLSLASHPRFLKAATSIAGIALLWISPNLQNMVLVSLLMFPYGATSLCFPMVSLLYVSPLSSSADQLPVTLTPLHPLHPVLFVVSTCKLGFLHSPCYDFGNARGTWLGGADTPGTFLAQLCLCRHWDDLLTLIPGVECSCICGIFYATFHVRSR